MAFEQPGPGVLQPVALCDSNHLTLTCTIKLPSCSSHTHCTTTSRVLNGTLNSCYCVILLMYMTKGNGAAALALLLHCNSHNRCYGFWVQPRILYENTFIFLIYREIKLASLSTHLACRSYDSSISAETTMCRNCPLPYEINKKTDVRSIMVFTSQINKACCVHTLYLCHINHCIYPL